MPALQIPGCLRASVRFDQLVPVSCILANAKQFARLLDRARERATPPAEPLITFFTLKALVRFDVRQKANRGARDQCMRRTAVQHERNAADA